VNENDDADLRGQVHVVIEAQLVAALKLNDG